MADAIRLQTEDLEYEFAVVMAAGSDNDVAAGIDGGIVAAAVYAAAVAAS